METVDNEGAIVVGVARGGHLSEGVVGFAVTTAQQLGVGIELVHVVPSLIGGPTGTWDVGITIDQLVREGESVLAGAVDQVRQRVDAAQPVSGRLLRGGVVDALVHRSSSAQLVVLEHRRLSWWDRLGTGSVTAGVAAHAHAPVVSVPSGWHVVDEQRPITVAVEDAKRADAELWTALGLAAASDRSVVVLRATYLAAGYEELMLHRGSHGDLLLADRRELQRDTALPVSVCERVPCTFEVRWGRPADVLVDASYGSSLLVMARRDPLLPFGSHLGPVVREVLRHTACPVMVVEPALARPVVPAPAAAPAGVTATAPAGPLVRHA